ncbi:hypothetical protein EV426DRAFT_54970 [Tirmania nivea]|nr:hypothetical protein EV426DRAFT_54970 [Tirmania nivea]
MTSIRLISRLSPRLLFQRLYSTPASSNAALEALSKPSWSVRSLLPKTNAASIPKTFEITPEKLRHLLRLAALPPPASEEEEADLMKTLLDQLHFVKDVQSVDTSGIEPLAVIRDEVSVREYSIQDIAPAAEKEVGKQGSVQWDVLSLAERKLGSYLVVDEAPAVEEGGSEDKIKRDVDLERETEGKDWSSSVN